MDKTAYITELFESAHLALQPAQAAAFARYAGLLAERNKLVNLTAVTEFPDIVSRHFLDSVLLFTDDVSRETFYGAAPGGGSVRLVDVGSGAGFPGLPIRIYDPSVRLTMIDSLDKRIRFLEDTVEELGLDGAAAVHARAEDAARDAALREAFDVCVSRAVAALPVLCEYCLPFVRVGGVFIAYKAKDCDAEIESAAGALRTLGGRLDAVREAAVPGTEVVRRLLVISKVSPTPDKFPRRAGKPERSPL